MTEIEFLRDNISLSWETLTKKHNQLFSNHILTKDGIRKICARNGIAKTDEMRKEALYDMPKEIREFIGENVEKYNNIELTNLINKTFDTNYSVKTITIAKRTNGFKSNGKFYDKAKLLADEKAITEIKELAKKHDLREIKNCINKKYGYGKTTVESVVKMLNIAYRVDSHNSKPKSDEFWNYFISIHNDYSDKQIAEMLSEKLGYKIAEKRIQKYRAKLGLKKEIIFKATPNPRAYKEGTMVLYRHVWYIKADGKLVKAKRYYYEKYHNVKLTSDISIHCVNGDIKDFSKENLIALTIEERNSLVPKCAGKGELTLAMLDVIRVRNKLKELNK